MCETKTPRWILILLLILGTGAILLSQPGCNLLRKENPLPVPSPSESGSPQPAPSASPAAPVVLKKAKGTVYWVGEAASEDNGWIQNTDSVYQYGKNHWLKHHGCADDERKPCTTGKENPFYCALPINDFKDESPNPKVRSRVPPEWRLDGPVSWIKNRWVHIRAKGKDAYCQIEDGGPFGEEDVNWVFGDALKPLSKVNQSAGIDLSPAAANFLGVSGVYDIEWRLVLDQKDVPPGPWREKITTSQVSW